MIWEVDENLDDMIDFDELQLTYFRNINDGSGSEPCSFFKLLEVRVPFVFNSVRFWLNMPTLPNSFSYSTDPTRVI